MFSFQVIFFLKYTNVKHDYPNIKQLRIKWVTISYAFQRSNQYCQTGKG